MLQECFRSGLNEMKLATTTLIANSSLLFKRVAATEGTALCKKQTTLEDRIASDTNYFHRIQTKKKIAKASYEPHYAVAETHLNFLHICKMVLQNNRSFCAFVCLVRDIN